MNEFFIYYWAGQDPELSIQAYEDRARQVAGSTCNLIVRRVDVSSASEGQKKHWNKNCTIECVTVKGGEAQERTACTPLPTAINPLIQNLCRAAPPSEQSDGGE